MQTAMLKGHGNKSLRPTVKKKTNTKTNWASKNPRTKARHLVIIIISNIAIFN